MPKDITILTTSGRKIRITPERASGVWALHWTTDTDRDLFTVTHVPSGLYVATRLSRIEADRVLACLATHYPDFGTDLPFGARTYPEAGMRRAIALALEGS